MFSKGDNYRDFLFVKLKDSSPKMVSTLKGKNLLQQKQILFFKRSPLMMWKAQLKIKELLPLKVYPFTLNTAGPRSAIGRAPDS